jgi:putative transposase
VTMVQQLALLLIVGIEATKKGLLGFVHQVGLLAFEKLLDVSTRWYARSLEPVPEDVQTRGASKSVASRALINKTQEQVNAFLNTRLDELSPITMFIDGIEIAGKGAIVALGISTDGTKTPLGVWLGSTESAVVTTELASKLIERGSRIVEKTLFIIDGGQGIRKALRDIFGRWRRAALPSAQGPQRSRTPARGASPLRCQAAARGVRRQGKSPKAASKLLVQLALWLESNGEDSAPESLPEDLDETLTVLGINLPPSLRRTFSTTNPIESMNATIPQSLAQREALARRVDDPALGRTLSPVRIALAWNRPPRSRRVQMGAAATTSSSTVNEATPYVA